MNICVLGVSAGFEENNNEYRKSQVKAVEFWTEVDRKEMAR